MGADEEKLCLCQKRLKLKKKDLNKLDFLMKKKNSIFLSRDIFFRIEWVTLANHASMYDLDLEADVFTWFKHTCTLKTKFPITLPTLVKKIGLFSEVTESQIMFNVNLSYACFSLDSVFHTLGLSLILLGRKKRRLIVSKCRDDVLSKMLIEEAEECAKHFDHRSICLKAWLKYICCLKNVISYFMFRNNNDLFEIDFIKCYFKSLYNEGAPDEFISNLNNNISLENLRESGEFFFNEHAFHDLPLSVSKLVLTTFASIFHLRIELIILDSVVVWETIDSTGIHVSIVELVVYKNNFSCFIINELNLL